MRLSEKTVAGAVARAWAPVLLAITFGAARAQVPADPSDVPDEPRAAEAPAEPAPTAAPSAASAALTAGLTLDSPLINAYDHLPLPEPGSRHAILSDAIMKEVRTAEPGKKRRLLATLKARLDYGLTSWRGLGEDDYRELERLLEAVRKGEDPIANETYGVRGYYAVNDDSCQPFRMSFPYSYRKDTPKRYPLVVDLHHHGWSDWYRPFQGYAYGVGDAIVIAPHGRGSCDYLWIAEDDVLACIDAAIADYPIDEARVYVTGWSMGGTGSFHLPGRYPHRFAASYPKAGNADFTAWEEAWKEDRQRQKTPLLEQRMFLRWETAPVTYAENFLHVPISIDHGALDSINPVGHSRSMAGRLQQLGYPNVAFRAGEGGHGWGSTLDERYDWMKRFKIDPRPKRVRFKTGHYRHQTAYWVTIDRIVRRMAMAEIDLEVRSARQIAVTKTQNIRQFTMKLSGLGLSAKDEVSVVFEDPKQSLPLPRPVPETVSLRQTEEDQWRIVTDEDRAAENKPVWPPRKRFGLEGPIEDAVRDPFLVVIGTSAEDPFEKWIVQSEAYRWLRQWRRRFQAVPPHKTDAEVTGDDIDSKNLILFGGPAQNTITRRVSPKLPVRIEGDAVIAGEKRYSGPGIALKLIYPNPENLSRTVVIHGAADWKGMWQISHRFGTWFDWMPLDNRQWFDFCVFDDRSRGFETFLDVGFFDEDWGLGQAVRFHGVPEWRERTPVRNFPKHQGVPDGQEEVRLSDLWPAQVDTAREPLRIDRSLNGLALSIGHERQRFGLGQWIESAVTYDLGGKFRRFRTKLGIDAEGQKAISDARRSVEYTEFVVMGDGRTLDRETSVQFGDPARTIDVDVEGVQRLTLMALRSMPQGWLYGPVCWGEPTLVR